MQVIKTIPENDILFCVKEVKDAQIKAMVAQSNALLVRCAAIDKLIDIGKNAGVAMKQAMIDIDESIKSFSLRKNEEVIPAKRDALGALVLDENGLPVDPGTEWKLGYAMGRAYLQCAQIAWETGVRFSPSLYHNKKHTDKMDRERAHAEKVRAAEIAADEAAKAAKAAAQKAARSKSAAVKAEAEKAKAEAEKAMLAARAVVDSAPESKKTGGRKAKSAAPAKVLTRNEVAMHATALVGMLRALGEECADEVADILADNNLLVSK